MTSGREHGESIASYRRVRNASMALCEPLAVEDHVIQAMADVSPPKWHLAHTTWFFETFILEPFVPGLTAFHPAYRVLFNSYYQSVGAQHPRPERGVLARPTVAEIRAYRTAVDEQLEQLLASLSADSESERGREIARRLTIGLHHEEQHQELLLMDIKYNFSRNPLRPTYLPPEVPTARPSAGLTPSAHDESLSWQAFDGGIVDIGHVGDGFSFDNESPRHRALVQPFELAARCVSNGEYLAFIEDGGYREPTLWLSDGWATVVRQGWQAPEYWHRADGQWHEFTLRGDRPLILDEPVAHVSYFEADAFARWSGARLPTEQEWELAARERPLMGNFVDSGRLHPAPARADRGSALMQLFGDVWEWTSSPYTAYPGYRPLPGALGEYNGKFMCNQFVLRGGSCLTPSGHIRASYRNFFYPHQRWNTQGIRLARDPR